MGKLAKIQAATAALTPQQASPAPTLATAPRSAAPSAPAPATDVLDDVQQLVVAAEATPHRIAVAYPDWLKMALALATQGEAGRDLFHRMSSGYPTYDPAEADKKFTNALKTKNGSVTIASFFKLCKDAGITLPAKPKRGRPSKKGRQEGFKALQETLAAKGHNVPTEALENAAVVVMQAKKDPSRKDGGLSNLTHPSGPLAQYPEVARTVVDHVQGNSNMVIQDDRRTATQDDIRDALSMDWNFYHDPGKRTYYYRPVGSDDPKDLKEFDERSTFLNRLLSDLERGGTKTDKRKLIEAVFNPHCYTEINYLTTHLDYLESQYKKEDGEDHIAALLKCIKTDNDPLFAVAFKKWLLNTVAQAYCNSSTCRNENALILVSPQQGIGKTFFFQNLLWDDQFFAAPPNFDFANKEHLLMMSENLLICFDEMGQYRKAEMDVMKASLSQSVIKADKKFQNTAQYPRTASFCGSTNTDEFLKDATGSRRFLPFTMLEPLNFAAYDAVVKAQLWGQVVAEYKTGADYRFTDEEKTNFNARNDEQFTADTPEDAFIAECLRITGNAQHFVTTVEISLELDKYKDHRKGQGFYRMEEVRKKLLQMPGVKRDKRRIAGAKPLNGLAGVQLKWGMM
ncbi:VapE domain-containing protein [Hymenobacter arizonensis]|uniref:Primase C terminal 2 (PriCT-2) n=1 Tax=Hymenobacter arizonensis TaxID=1227077 RepID=A0A1I5Z275_HYMAR|nr:VapE domain-containing protein [Hymenobacter arizonensis]SFQ50445.1 Primase C terminal 2 (PriCT-2) [Hymenobacter arizonensis]